MRDAAPHLPPPRFLRTLQAASYCGRSRSDFEKRRLRGDGPPFRKIGRVIVYDLADLDAWMERHTLLRSTSELPSFGSAGSTVRARDGQE